jgi:3-hydroxyacyl-CoA dehydrogenase
MTELAAFTKQGNVGIVTLNNPPVNALSHALRLALQTAFSAALADEEVRGIVLCCAGRTFVAGADIREFDLPSLTPDVHEIIEWVGHSSKPVTAALHGTALGGGAELALACHFRVAAPDAQIGFPEVQLGILPGAGGTQRLPRLIGVRPALDLIVGGAPIPATEALALGLIDELIQGDLLSGAVAFASAAIASAKPWGKVSDRKIDFDDPGFFERYSAGVAQKTRGFLAPTRVVEAIRAAVELPFDAGLEREREYFRELVRSPQSKAQRHAFFGEREVSKSPRLPRDVLPREVRAVGVIGAGEGALQFTKPFAQRRVPVTLLTEQFANGATTPEEQLPGVRLAKAYHELASVDIVVLALAGEALKGALAALEAVCAPETVFAIASSDVNLQQAASLLKHPERLAGLRFEGAKLMEIVATDETSAVVNATLMNLAKVLRKVAILERANQGSAATRLREACLQEARARVAQGASVALVNAALAELGTLRLETPKNDPAPHRDAHEAPAESTIRDACSSALIREGLRLLDEGVVARALEVDMVAVCGHGFPVYLGGPLFHAEQVGSKDAQGRKFYS